MSKLSNNISLVEIIQKCNISEEKAKEIYNHIKKAIIIESKNLERSEQLIIFDLIKITKVFIPKNQSNRKAYEAFGLLPTNELKEIIKIKEEING